MSRINKKQAFSLTIIIAIAFIALTGTALLISSVFQLASFSKTERESIIDKQILIAKDASRTVSDYISAKIDSIRNVMRAIHMAEASRALNEQTINSLLGLDLAYRQIVILDTNGATNLRASRIPLDKAEEITRSYISDLMSTESENDINYTAVYIDEYTNEPLMYMSIPITNLYQEVTGYLAVEIYLKFMWEIMGAIKVGETGYAYVVDNRGYIIASHDSARVLGNENLKHIISVEKFMNNELEINTFIYKGLEGNQVIGSVIALDFLNWAVITELPLAEADAPINQSIFWSIIFVIIIALVAGGFGIFLAWQLSIPIIKLTKTATRIAQGEMGLQADVSGAKEVAVLAEVFNQSHQYLMEIITKAKELTIHLNSSTQQIQSATQEQTSAANQSASGTTEVSATMEELSITAKQITHNVGELVVSSQESIKALQEIGNQLRRVTDQLTEVTGISQKNTKEIEELGKRSVIINEMVELIKEVASKTNILSINASIEASRHSQRGSGFSVVASEIRDLSKETIDSAKKAEQAGRDIQDFLDSIIISSASESDKVARSSEITNGIFKNIEEVIGKINLNYNFTQKIDISIKQQEKGSIEAAETMRQMSEVARQSAQTSQQIQVAIKDITNLSKTLEKIVNR
ncbi:MAG: methyl-accepting chemotaxis protein [Spirochaetales bacterium]|nr:methyl-accepting chemotaxis protein [Spirochaetales bacterium]